MRIDDLDLRELFDFSPQGGVLHFAGQRVLLIDAVALGLLRKELIETLGITAARGILTRMGFAHGWRTAQSLRQAIPWENEHEWRIAGGRLHMLQGLVVFEAAPGERDRREDPFAQARWHASYEAEQHRLNLGPATGPVCWTLCGFASGYLSHANGREIYCVETRCAGCGDEACEMLARTREHWGPALDEHLPYYRSDCLPDALREVTDALKRAESRLERRRRAMEGSPGLVAHSDAMLKALDLARRVAKVDSTALVTGESGVGKERVARLIHQESARARGPFVAINCGAIAETLLESELFGHMRGAFTGADRDRPGLFEAASGGTLLLDEIGEVSPSMQVKLLRAIQEREVRRVGEARSRPVDVRIVAATHRDLGAEVEAGRFRGDLYYRLRVIEIRVPPLRERRDDILPLARATVERVAAKLGLRVTGFTPAAADRLVAYRWPGNVRELENAVERAVVLAEGSRFDVDDLPEEIRQSPPAAPPAQASVAPPGATLAAVERAHILATLDAQGGHRAQTARALGISEATLYRKLRDYGSR